MRLDMVRIDAAEFAALREQLPSTTAQGLFDTYRISQNTWYKLRDGQPIKRSTLDRLRTRHREIRGEPA